MSELIEKRNARLKSQAEAAEAAAKKAAEEAARKKSAPEITWPCEECGINHVKRKGTICPECKAKRKAAVAEPVKILTAKVMAEHIASSRLKIAGELAVQGWALRKGKAGRRGTKNTTRTGELEYLIEIYRQLKAEGYQ